MARHARNTGFALCAAIVALSAPAWAAIAADARLDELVRTDWAGQERRRGRSPDDPEAVTAAYRRTQALLRNTAGRSGTVLHPDGTYAEEVKL